jgi:hypothetical protein
MELPIVCRLRVVVEARALPRLESSFLEDMRKCNCVKIPHSLLSAVKASIQIGPLHHFQSVRALVLFANGSRTYPRDNSKI